MNPEGINYEDIDVVRSYDQGSEAMGTDVLAGLLHIHTGKPLKDLYVLDAGCGTGRYSTDLIKFGIGKISLLDKSLTMLEMAKEKLKDEIRNNIVVDIVTASLPDFPFRPASFDVVMFNFVLHYLDSDVNSGYPMIEETLRNAKTVLKQNGLVAVTTMLPSIYKQSVWYMSLIPDYTNAWAKKLPTTEEFMELFAKSGFRCVSALNFLRRGTSAGLLNHLDAEGPLKPEWRRASASFPEDDDMEIKRMEKVVLEMKQNGTLKKYMADRDHTSEFGFGSLFISMSI